MEHTNGKATYSEIYTAMGHAARDLSEDYRQATGTEKAELWGMYCGYRKAMDDFYFMTTASEGQLIRAGVKSFTEA